MYSDRSIDGGKVWKEKLDGNPESFEGVYKANTKLDVGECTKIAAAAHEAVRAKLAEQLPGDVNGTTKLDVLAEIFVSQLLNKKNKEAFAHYIEREWPKISKHEVAADVELSGEMELAAAELSRFLGELD